MNMITWNPWHGCHKISPGCQHCYVYRMDAQYERDSTSVSKNRDFDLPLRRDRQGAYKIPPGAQVGLCFTSDFLLADADAWRPQAWAMIRQRSDVFFFFITKRIDRLQACLPPDWGAGYANVGIGCTVENQDRADYRLPIFRQAPIAEKTIICEPLLEHIDLSAYLGPWVQAVVAGGESGRQARVCDYAWILDLRRQCMEANVAFSFKQTGARLKKDGKIYRVRRPDQHAQAQKAGIAFVPKAAHKCPACGKCSEGVSR